MRSRPRCLKITKKYHSTVREIRVTVYILSGQKFIKNANVWILAAAFKQSYQTGHLDKNWCKMPKLRKNCDILIISKGAFFFRSQLRKIIKYQSTLYRRQVNKFILSFDCGFIVINIFKDDLKMLNISQCLKITEKVAFNMASEASYFYILSRQNFIKNAKNRQFLKNWSSRSNSVTRKVTINRPNIGGKCQNSKI